MATWRRGDVILGLYEVLDVVRAGRLGLVHRVRHRGWDIDLAVKTPRLAVVHSPDGIRDFEREAEVWVGLGLHPHIANCVYVRTLDGVPRVFAEWADGGSLAEAVRSRNALRERPPGVVAGRRDPVRVGARPRARERGRAPGRQARQRDAHPGRHGQGHRLRPGPGPHGHRGGCRGRGSVRQPRRPGSRVLLARTGAVAERAHDRHGRVVLGGHRPRRCSLASNRLRTRPRRVASSTASPPPGLGRGPVRGLGRGPAGAGRSGGPAARVLHRGPRRAPRSARAARGAPDPSARAGSRPVPTARPGGGHSARRRAVQPRAVHAGPRPPRQRRGAVDPGSAGGSAPPARPLQPRAAPVADRGDHRRRAGRRTGVRAVGGSG